MEAAIATSVGFYALAERSKVHVPKMLDYENPTTISTSSNAERAQAIQLYGLARQTAIRHRAWLGFVSVGKILSFMKENVQYE